MKSNYHVIMTAPWLIGVQRKVSSDVTSKQFSGQKLTKEYTYLVSEYKIYLYDA